MPRTGWRWVRRTEKMDFGGEFGALQSGKAFQVRTPQIWSDVERVNLKGCILPQHPVVCLCHVGFRTCALLVYLFGGMFSSSFIGVFVSVVLLLSIDFWTVKNITGRILVRWLIKESTAVGDVTCLIAGWSQVVELHQRRRRVFLDLWEPVVSGGRGHRGRRQSPQSDRSQIFLDHPGGSTLFVGKGQP